MPTEINRDFLNAVKSNNLIMIQNLLLQSADVNAMDEGGRYGLHWAVINESLTMIEFLLSKKAYIDPEDFQGFTPFDLVFVNDKGNLDYSSYFRNEEIAKLLIRKGAFVNTYCQGVPLLNDLICNGHYDLALLALDHGAEVNAFEIIEDDELSARDLGTTALHRLAKTGKKGEAIIQKLLSLNANVNACDRKGRTPLHLAAKYENISMVRILLAAGTNVDLMDEHKRTAADIAENEKYKDIAQLIRDYKNNNRPIYFANRNVGDTTTNVLVRLNINKPQVPHANTHPNLMNVPKTPKKPPRITLEIDRNHTPALGKSEMIQPTQNLLEQIENSSQLIIEHARRRVDFYFHLLIYYYNTGWEVKLDQTVLQHGVGQNNPHNKKKPYLRACHSSLFPSPYGVTAGGRMKVIWPRNSYFYNLLNSTVTLPHRVNVIDTYLEGKIKEELQSLWRSEALEIMNQVSQNGLTPIAGLNRFFDAADRFFEGLLNRYRHSPHDMRICEYEYTGTVNCNWIRDAGVSRKYIHLHLRLTPQEEEIINGADDQANIIYGEKYKQLRQEMLLGTIPPKLENGNQTHLLKPL